jgi:hypothetical protein
MDITDINETDPRKVIVEIDKIIRPDVRRPFGDNDRGEIRSYFQKLKHAAENLGLEFPIHEPKGEIANNSAFDGLFDNIVEEIEKQKINIVVQNANRQNGIALDGAWREKIHTYVAHIRRLVNSADDLPPKIKESILAKLRSFDAEVDRGRTRMQVFTDLFVELCQGISAGATALTPAVRLGERIIGALARLQGEPPLLALPPPDQFNLPSPELIGPSPETPAESER